MEIGKEFEIAGMKCTALGSMGFTKEETNMLMSLSDESFSRVFHAKRRHAETVRKTQPADDAPIMEIAAYHQSQDQIYSLADIHAKRQGLRPGSLVIAENYDQALPWIGYIDAEWYGDPDYVHVYGPNEHEEEYVGVDSFIDVISCKPEQFQKLVNLHPAHYLHVYKELEIYNLPGFENIVFPAEYQDVKETVVDLKELGV